MDNSSIGAAYTNPFASRGNQVAVLIDFENVCRVGCSAIRSLITSIAASENVAVLRGYGDWRRFPQARHALDKAGVRLMDLPSNSVGKNGADMHLAVQALALAAQNPSLGKFVIIAGDRDFVAMAEQLREWGCQVWGYGTEGSSSDRLKAACNRFAILKADGANRTKNAANPVMTSKKTALVVAKPPIPKVAPSPSEHNALPKEFIMQAAWAIRAVQIVNSALQEHADWRALMYQPEAAHTLLQRTVSMAHLFGMLRLFDSSFSAERLTGSKNRSHIKLAERLQRYGILNLLVPSDGGQHLVQTANKTSDYLNILYRPLTYFAAIEICMDRRGNLARLNQTLNEISR